MKAKCDLCLSPATRRNVDGGRVCQRHYDAGYSDEMPDMDEDAPDFLEPKHVNKQETLVNRLRMPIDPHRSIIHLDNDISNLGLREVADKLDAIGEALAYLIEKKHAKVKTKKLKTAISDHEALRRYRKNKHGR